MNLKKAGINSSEIYSLAFLLQRKPSSHQRPVTCVINRGDFCPNGDKMLKKLIGVHNPG